jgi:oligosaccharide reducing-end xylanase
MFNAKGFKLTLFTVVTGGMFPGWTKLQSAAAQGHEIASHTMTHTSLKGMAAANQITELRNSRDSINAHVPGRQCVTQAYPYCDRGTDSIALKYYIANRTCSGQIVSKNPSNFADISSVICGSTGSNSTTALNTQANSAAASNGWCVYLFHGVENDGGYSPIATSALQGNVDYMSSNPSKFWVETFGNVARYIRERTAASVRAVSRTADSIVLRVTDTLNDTLFNYPITIRRPLPAGWQTVKVTQGTGALASQTKDSNNITYVYFDAIPDAGNVVISRNTTAVRHEKTTISGSRAISLKRQGTYLALSGLPSDGRTFSIARFDLRGALLSRIGSIIPQGGEIFLPSVNGVPGFVIVEIVDLQSGLSSRLLMRSCVLP